MTELFADIRQEVRNTSEIIWNLASQITDPVTAANFLNNTIGYYSNLYTEEEMEFLQFALQTKMEMKNINA